MSLGNFNYGSVVRLPLHITQDGGIPVSGATRVVVEKIILPSGSYDSNFPKSMSVADSNFSVYFLDYKPSQVGNYIVIYSFTLGGITYSSIDTFYLSQSSGSGSNFPYARPVSFIGG